MTPEAPNRYPGVLMCGFLQRTLESSDLTITLSPGLKAGSVTLLTFFPRRISRSDLVKVPLSALQAHSDHAGGPPASDNGILPHSW